MARFSLLNDAKLAALVVAWSLDGLSSAVIARQLSEQQRAIVSDAAVRRFLAKHKPQKAAAIDQAIAIAGNPSIAEKAWRTSQAQQQYDALIGIVGSRGFMAKDVKWIGGGFEGREVEIERFDAALSKELRELRREVAEELGQIPTGKQREGDGPALHLYHVTIVDGRADAIEVEYQEA